MKLFLLIPLSALFFVACTTEDNSKIIRKVSHKTTFSSPKIEVNRMLTMEIEGMMCVMGCGASIRKELKTTNAIGNVEFDFEKDRKTNIAKISFNKDKITADKIISIVSKMNDKQFKIGKTTSEEIECEVSSKECKEKCEKSCDSEEKSTISMSSTSSIEIPNLVNILTHFFVN